MAEYVISEKLYNVVSNVARSRMITLPKDFAVGKVSQRTYVDAIEILEAKCVSVAEIDRSWDQYYGYEIDLADKTSELSERFLKIEEMSNNITKTQELEKVCVELLETELLMHKIRDLKIAKEIYLEDLKYTKTPEEITEWSNRFDEAYRKRDIDKMISILDEVRKINKEEWVKYVNDSNGDDFAFIGHSISCNTEDLRGKHHSTYISASYFNSEFNTTFQMRYGYIMPGSGVMSARPFDTYTNNDAKDEEDALRGTSVPVISHPLTIINTMKRHREENETLMAKGDEEVKVGGKVYSEIVFDKFEPIGIFCFTNGLKELDQSYKNAEELHKNSPDLPYKVIDVLKYKKGYELDDMKLEILNTLKRKHSENIKLNPLHYYDYQKKDLPLFDMFFSNLEKIKQKDNYSVDEIMNAYKRNRELLFTDQYELFSSSFLSFNEEETKYILDKGYYFSIDSILKGTAGFATVNNLSTLASFKDNEKFKNIVTKYYPGLMEFSQLVNKIPLTEEMYNEIKKNPLSFSSLNQYLYPIVKQQQDLEISLIKDELDAKQMELEEQLRKKAIIDQGAEKYDKCSRIESNEYSIGIIEANINQKNKVLVELNKDKEYYQTERDNKNEKYSRLSEINKIAKRLEDELAVLVRHPLINSKKIKEIKKKLIELSGEENDNNIRKIRVDMDKLELDINGLDMEISLYETRIQVTKDEITFLQERLQSNFGTTDISEAKQVVIDAKKFIEQYNEYSYNIMGLNTKDLEVEIAKLQNQLQEKGQTISTM